MKGKITIETITVLLIILFMYAAINKIMDQDFRTQLGKSPFITQYAGLLVWAVPTVEIVISLLLVYKRTRLLGLYASLFLMTVFTGYIYLMLHYSYYVPCSCGGVLEDMTWEQHLVFNFIYTLITIPAILLLENNKTILTTQAPKESCLQYSTI